MNLQAAAIIIAGALIAGAIALTNGWEMVYFNAGSQGAKAIHSALLMNRWTGIITICAPTMMTGEFRTGKCLARQFLGMRSYRNNEVNADRPRLFERLKADLAQGGGTKPGRGILRRGCKAQQP